MADSGGVGELEKRRNVLRAEFERIGDLRPGSLVERYRRCGRAGCHCAAPGAAGHGPCWSLTKGVDGKTVTRVIPSGPAVAQVQAEVAEYRRFRRLVREFIEVSEKLSDARLESPEAASKEAAKKGGSKRTSMRRWSGKSKR